MSNCHQFAFFMALVCLFARILMGLPSDWAAICAIAVGLSGAYVLFYSLIKFVSERMAEYGLVWKWK